AGGRGRGFPPSPVSRKDPRRACESSDVSLARVAAPERRRPPGSVRPGAPVLTRAPEPPLGAPPASPRIASRGRRLAVLCAFRFPWLATRAIEPTAFLP